MKQNKTGLDLNYEKQWEKLKNRNNYYGSVKVGDLIWNDQILKYLLDNK